MPNRRPFIALACLCINDVGPIFRRVQPCTLPSGDASNVLGIQSTPSEPRREEKSVADMHNQQDEAAIVPFRGTLFCSRNRFWKSDFTGLLHAMLQSCSHHAVDLTSHGGPVSMRLRAGGGCRRAEDTANQEDAVLPMPILMSKACCQVISRAWAYLSQSAIVFDPNGNLTCSR